MEGGARLYYRFSTRANDVRMKNFISQTSGLLSR